MALNNFIEAINTKEKCSGEDGNRKKIQFRGTAGGGIVEIYVNSALQVSDLLIDEDRLLKLDLKDNDHCKRVLSELVMFAASSALRKVIESRVEETPVVTPFFKTIKVDDQSSISELSELASLMKGADQFINVSKYNGTGAQKDGGERVRVRATDNKQIVKISSNLKLTIMSLDINEENIMARLSELKVAIKEAINCLLLEAVAKSAEYAGFDALKSFNIDYEYYEEMNDGNDDQ